MGLWAILAVTINRGSERQLLLVLLVSGRKNDLVGSAVETTLVK